MKRIIIIAMAFIIFASCNSVKLVNTQVESDSIVAQQTGFDEPQQLDFASMFKILNKPIFDVDSVDSFNGLTEEEIFQYSEMIKGEFSVTINAESIFPTELVSMLEESLYNSCNYNRRILLIGEITNSTYFDTLKTLGSENLEVGLDELYNLFPELYKHKDEFKYQDDAYKFIYGSENYLDMFHINMTPNEDNYIFVYRSGGSNGVVSVQLTKLINNEFITISEFEAQNQGDGKVVKYGEFFYYVFLQYNYNLKNYDGIRLHKLGVNADTETVLIRYLPKKYIWKNIYNVQTSFANLSSYIESIKDVITSDEYLENGAASSPSLFYGVETEGVDFVLAENV